MQLIHMLIAILPLQGNPAARIKVVGPLDERRMGQVYVDGRPTPARAPKDHSLRILRTFPGGGFAAVLVGEASGPTTYETSTCVLLRNGKLQTFQGEPIVDCDKKGTLLAVARDPDARSDGRARPGAAYLFREGKRIEIGPAEGAHLGPNGAVVRFLLKDKNGRPLGRDGDPRFMMTKEAFLWRNGEIRYLGPWIPTGMNSHGEIVGRRVPGSVYLDGEDDYPLSVPCEVVLWSHGKLASLGRFGGFSAVSAGIRENGEIVGVRLAKPPGKSEGAARIFTWKTGATKWLPTRVAIEDSVSLDWQGRVVINKE